MDRVIRAYVSNMKMWETAFDFTGRDQQVHVQRDAGPDGVAACFHFSA
jgi:hypothetical protein